MHYIFLCCAQCFPCNVHFVVVVVGIVVVVLAAIDQQLNRGQTPWSPKLGSSQSRDERRGETGDCEQQTRSEPAVQLLAANPRSRFSCMCNVHVACLERVLMENQLILNSTGVDCLSNCFLISIWMVGNIFCGVPIKSVQSNLHQIIQLPSGFFGI